MAATTCRPQGTRARERPGWLALTHTYTLTLTLTLTLTRYESGLDDSPMYDGDFFNVTGSRAGYGLMQVSK